MGSYAVLELGGQEILMGKNHHVWTHQTIFQVADFTWIPRGNDNEPDRKKRGYKTTLRDLPPRLELMGINLASVRDHYENPHPSYDEVADVPFDQLLEILLSVDDPFPPDNEAADPARDIGSLVSHLGRYEILLFFDLDFERAKGLVVFNGPEHVATASLPAVLPNQRSLTKGQIRSADGRVDDADRLNRIDVSSG